MDRGQALTWRECEHIINSELRRFRGTLPGYDRDDLAQECRLAAARCLERIDVARSRGVLYVRTAIRNRLTNLLREQTTQARMPHDPYGRPLSAMPELDDRFTDSRKSPEAQANNRAVVRYLADRLDPRDWRDLVRLAMDGAEHVLRRDEMKLVRLRVQARAILNRITYRVDNESEVTMSTIPLPKPEDMPTCHAAGTAPQGYEQGDLACIGCRDKFSCLPLAIEKKLRTYPISVDREVQAVVEKKVPIDQMMNRLVERDTILDSGKKYDKLPAEMKAEWPGLLGEVPEEPEDDASDESTDEAEASNDNQEDENVATKKQKKKAGKKKAPPPPKAAKKKAAKKKAGKKAASKGNGRPRIERPDGWPCMTASKKPLPPPRSVSEEEMRESLKDIQKRLGANVKLDFGMSLVRKKRDGEVVAKITPQGYEYELSAADAKAAKLKERTQLFSSISSIAMWADKRMVSGPDFFNIAKHNCTEVRDKKGKVIDKKGGVGKSAS